MGRFWEGLGGQDDFKIESKRGPKAHSIKNWMFGGFGDGLGSDLGEVWEVFGTCSGGFSGVFGRFLGEFWKDSRG